MLFAQLHRVISRQKWSVNQNGSIRGCPVSNRQTNQPERRPLMVLLQTYTNPRLPQYSIDATQTLKCICIAAERWPYTNSYFARIHNKHAHSARVKCACLFQWGKEIKPLPDPSGSSLSPAGIKDRACWNLTHPSLLESREATVPMAENGRFSRPFSKLYGKL